MDLASYRDQLAEARRRLDGGEIDAAVPVLTGLVQARPKWPGAFVALADVAAKRRNWPVAVERWDKCLSRFPEAATPEWRRARALALLELNRFEDAEAELRALAADQPDDRQIAVGLARCAMHAQNWDEALSIWTRLCDHAGADASADWRTSRAKCLAHAGNLEEAAAAYREVLSEHPGHAAANAGLAGLLLQTGRKEETAAHLRRVRESAGDTFGLHLQACALAANSGDMALARRELQGARELIGTVEQIDAFLNLMPRILQGWELTRAWLNCEKRLRVIAGRTGGAEPTLLAMRLRISLRDYDGFLSLWDGFEPATDSSWTRRLSQLAAQLRAPAFPDVTAEKVIGLGLPRTGSTSLHHALEELGYLAAHWTNTFTGALLTVEDAFLFDAMTDGTAASVFEQIYHAFPNSRFIVADRPVETWLPSFERLITRQFGAANFQDLSQSMLTDGDRLSYGMGMRLNLSTFWRGHPDPIAARAAWRARIDNFIALHDERRFLRFDIFSGDGWEKLCGFLGKPIPSQPFPHENRAGRIKVRE